MNVKEELINFLKRIEKTDQDILCACIGLHNLEGREEASYDRFRMPKNTSSSDLLESLKDLEYNNGYGMQYLFGIIWFKDNTWAKREEYDGSEWWSHFQCPLIPEFLEASDED